MRLFPIFIFTLFLVSEVSALTQPSSFVNQQIEQLNIALKYYISIDKSKNWQYLSIPPDSIRFYQKTPVVKKALRNNLCLTGDLPEGVININGLEEDSALFYALKYFQFRHGIQETGTLNKETIREINTPLCDRIEKIKLNIKRWENFLLKDENLYVLVNIPEFNLRVIKNGEITHKMKVIVGKKNTPTITFYEEIEQIVINPSWSVPNSIIRNELFPKIKSDPNYLSKNHYKIYSGAHNKRKEIGWHDLDWSKLTPFTFNYSIEQTPGRWNALGSIKFVFPNNHDIYLHDTQEKSLFNNRVRTYSHGCVRVEKPFELADYLIQETTNISSELLKKSLSKDATKVIRLEYKVPISLSYFTCFIGEDQSLNFREDIYNLDVIAPDELDYMMGKL